MLRIAFDLDGTLADLDSALDRIAEELFPDVAGGLATPNPQPPESPAPDHEANGLTPEEEQLEPPEVRALTRRQQMRIWDTVRGTTNFWETLDETEPGIVARIAAIADERRWEVLFITQRPAADGDTTQRQSQRWLAQHGFNMPSVYVLGAGASRGKVATALTLDVVVDDRSENCLDVKLDSGARSFLVARRAGSQVAANARRLGIEVVQTVGDCLDILTTTTKEKAGLIGRIRKAFARPGEA